VVAGGLLEGLEGLGELLEGAGEGVLLDGVVGVLREGAEAGSEGRRLRWKDEEASC